MTDESRNIRLPRLIEAEGDLDDFRDFLRLNVGLPPLLDGTAAARTPLDRAGTSAAAALGRGTRPGQLDQADVGAAAARGRAGAPDAQLDQPGTASLQACQHCLAGAGQPCSEREGTLRPQPHQGRRQGAQNANADADDEFPF